MARHLLVLSKVIGTATLGILAGTAASATFVTLPGIVHAESSDSPRSIKQLLLTLYRGTLGLVKPLALGAFGSLIAAYVFSPPTGRHPYLMYSALSVPVLGALSYLFDTEPLLSPLTDPAETPKLAPTPKAKIPEPDEPSLLDNSVYARVDSAHTSDTDASSESSVAESQAAIAARSLAHQGDLDSIAKSAANLHSLGLWATVTTGTAFLISTVGIYGDMA